MKSLLRLSSTCLVTATAMLALSAGTAHAQWWKLNNGNVAVGGTGQFNTILTDSPRSVAATTSNNAPVTVLNQRQDTTWSAGFIGSLQFHPVSWAGVEVNYGFTRYQERYSFNYAGTAARQSVAVPVDYHEATAGYLIHPKHIPFQPYVVVGGGAIDFNPHGNAVNAKDVTYGSAQWRGAGLLEAGFDLPTHNKHIGFRISGRSLYYRSPNFQTAAISTRSWRVTTEPAVSVFYKF
ncbi:MAG: hypothetical protein PW792_14735 [Acidobacteriaceae bacterium]|nr:hypothetical protein [Acidobacteriaceae bacterium]